MIAPAIAVWAAAQWSTSWVLFATEMLGVLGGVLIWVVDPPLRGEGEVQVGDAVRVPVRTWFRLPFLAVCLAALASTLVLSGSDIGIVATMRELDAVAQIGIVLALWGLGSLRRRAALRRDGPVDLAVLAARRARARHRADGAGRLGVGPGGVRLPGRAALRAHHHRDRSTRPAGSCRRRCAVRRWAGTGRSSPPAGRSGRRSPGSRSTAAARRPGSSSVAVVGLLVAVAGVATQRARQTARERRQPSPR